MVTFEKRLFCTTVVMGLVTTSAAWAGNVANVPPQVATKPLMQLAQSGPVNPDDRFWRTIKDSSLPDLFEMFIKRYPDSPHRANAEQRLAALRGTSNQASAEEQAKTMLQPAKPAPPAPARSTQPATSPTVTASIPRARPPVAAFPTRGEIMVIQAELMRVGCLPGQIDGVWGPQTQGAANQFVRFAGLQSQLAVAGPALLGALRKAPGQVCRSNPAPVPAAVRPPPAPAATAQSAAKPEPTATRPARQTRRANSSEDERGNWAESFINSQSGLGGDGGGGGSW